MKNKMFKKKEKTEEELFVEKQLKKLPRKRRKRALILYELARKGYFLRPGQDIDNKEMLKAGLEYYNGKIS